MERRGGRLNSIGEFGKLPPIHQSFHLQIFMWKLRIRQSTKKVCMPNFPMFFSRWSFALYGRQACLPGCFRAYFLLGLLVEMILYVLQGSLTPTLSNLFWWRGWSQYMLEPCPSQIGSPSLSSNKHGLLLYRQASQIANLIWWAFCTSSYNQLAFFHPKNRCQCNLIQDF